MIERLTSQVDKRIESIQTISVVCFIIEETKKKCFMSVPNLLLIHHSHSD